MTSFCTRIRSTCAVELTSRSRRSRLMPLVMASEMISEATPTATHTMEMTLITPTTARRRFALKYRAATKNSKRIDQNAALHVGHDFFTQNDLSSLNQNDLSSLKKRSVINQIKLSS